MAKKKEHKQKKIEIVNRKAEFEYHFLSEFEAGIMLTGTEIKSIRLGNVNLKDAYCFVKNGEVFVKSMFIAEYKFGSIHNHETRRTRKLLLKKQEIKKIDRRIREKGNTLVPYMLYLSDRGLAKLKIVLASGKQSYDKRASIKERESKRDLNRLNKMKL